MKNIESIIQYIDKYLENTNQQFINPVIGNEVLEEAGLLNDSMSRPGLPLRRLLRSGELPHAYQSGGKGSQWKIPHSTNKIASKSNNSSAKVVVSDQSIEKIESIVLSNNKRILELEGKVESLLKQKCSINQSNAIQQRADNVKNLAPTLLALMVAIISLAISIFW